jgi:type IV pilus assembly protein PilB
MIGADVLEKLLVEPGHIKKEPFDGAKKEAEDGKLILQDLLVEKGLIRDDQLGRLVAEHLGFTFAELAKESIDNELLSMIPELVARSKGVIAYARKNGGVMVGMVNPNDLETRHMIEKRIGEKIFPFYITRRDLEGALVRYSSSLRQVFDEHFKILNNENLTRGERDDAIIKMVDTLLQYGYQNQASDIHIEPYRGKVMIRFRIDGVLHDVLELPKNLHELALTRIKILAKMRTDEHRSAQDGKFRFTIQKGVTLGQEKEEAIDVRVSIVPIVEGENAVMRLLSSKGRRFQLEDLGLSGDDLKKVQKAIKNPHGMILVTGPTGSGKTTTLYSILKILNTRNVHISTIEDPVEYDIEGVSQIQVNPKTNLTFASGLRAVVRQDPDIIMVGEIRDSDTADIAVNSAMTGHLVLSTLHANNAATTLPRLLDMGIEPFLVSSTVRVIVAQRLVRKICERCRVSYTISAEDKKMIEQTPEVKDIFIKEGHKDLNKITLYKGAGCKACGDTGYGGRIGIFEILEMAEKIRRVIIKEVTSDDIYEAAAKNGMTTMLRDGILKTLGGITTLEEVLRVTRE